MAAARANGKSNSFLPRLAGSVVLVSLSAACAAMDPAYSIVTHDRFDFMECPQIISERGTWTGREKQLTDLVQKAESAPGGIIVSAVAYRTELTAARTQLRLVQQAAQQKGCDAKKP